MQTIFDAGFWTDYSRDSGKQVMTVITCLLTTAFFVYLFYRPRIESWIDRRGT